MKNHNRTRTEVFELLNPRVSPDNYGSKEKYRDHVFEQYKLYIEMTHKQSERRTFSNTFFLTLNTLIIGVLSFSYDSILVLEERWVIFFPLFAVLTLCYAWRKMLLSYKQLSAAKFRVIGKFEELLPTCPYVEAEWRALGFGEDSKVYKPITDVENWIPIIFALLYIFGVFFFLISTPAL